MSDEAVTPTFDCNTDLLVIGSGAAGLSAASVAVQQQRSVMVLEKSPWIGGTSATSGGGVWIPGSPRAPEADNPEDAFNYLRALAGEAVTNARIAAFVKQAPLMLEWFATHTELNFVSVPYPDYHQETVGARTGWRTHFPVDFDGKRLGPLVNRIREASPAASFLGIINWTLAETHVLLHRPPAWQWVFLKMIWRYLGDIPQRLRSRRDRYLTLGNAIIGALTHYLAENGVAIHTEASPQELICDDSGAVIGARVTLQGRTVCIRAKAVVIATGGFERNAMLRKRYLPTAGQNPEMSGSQDGNTGDALALCEKVDAGLLNMDSAWWAPVFKVPGEYRARLCAFERAFPGCIMVNQDGERYMNEAVSYHVAAQKMIAIDSEAHNASPSWIIFDSTFRHHYPMGPLLPIPLLLHSRAVRETVIKANDLEELAVKTGLPEQGLSATLERFNEYAAQGHDPDFGRGASEYDRYYGDPRVSPNPTLAPIKKPPYFAMLLHIGDIGTNGGLATNEHAQVLNRTGTPVAGLYAAGNCSASVMGHCYPAAGGTLGPALTFGFIAARHALGVTTEDCG